MRSPSKILVPAALVASFPLGPRWAFGAAHGNPAHFSDPMTAGSGSSGSSH